MLETVFPGKRLGTVIREVDGKNITTHKARRDFPVENPQCPQGELAAGLTALVV